MEVVPDSANRNERQNSMKANEGVWESTTGVSDDEVISIFLVPSLYNATLCWNDRTTNTILLGLHKDFSIMFVM